jgi:transmembrane sensor
MTRASESMAALGVDEVASLWFGRRRVGELSPADLEAFADWLAQADEHREAYERLERAWSGIEPIRDDPRVMAWREQALRRNPAWRRLLMPALMAASLLLAAGGGLLSWQMGVFPDHRLQTRSFHTGHGERTTITLPDGSQVTLNTDTVVRTQAMEGRRQVYLDQGQAFFRVAHDPLHPFVVNAAGRTVTAVGTAFDVRVDHDRFAVTLVEGKVRVEAPVPERAVAATASRPAPDVPLHVQSTEMVAGTQLESTDETAWKLVPVDAVRETSWTRGQLVFLRRPLGEVVDELNRYSGTQIVIDDDALADVPITGTFTPGDNEGFAAAVVSYGKASIEQKSGETIRLVGRRSQDDRKKNRTEGIG